MHTKPAETPSIVSVFDPHFVPYAEWIQHNLYDDDSLDARAPVYRVRPQQGCRTDRPTQIDNIGRGSAARPTMVADWLSQGL